MKPQACDGPAPSWDKPGGPGLANGIRIVCPECRVVDVAPPDARSGSTVACVHCGSDIIVPDPREEGAPVGLATLAGSPDDRQVSLPPAAHATTLLLEEGSGPQTVEDALAGAKGAAGRYLGQGVIGKGGMGEITLCIDRNIRRQVAMKRILPAVANDPDRRARFVEEAQVTGQLEHPNIVPVHELEMGADGTIYFTMKLVRGRSLGETLRADRQRADEPTLGELLQIFLKVCDGVAFAHSRGVIHRDLKPDNIMVGDFGEVLVMDWGLAKIVGRKDISAGELVTSSRLEGSIAHTMEGVALGTPAYMPPEQAGGRLDAIDHRSDIYSLGGILYEMLTLERPVEGNTPMEVLTKVTHGNIVPPEQRAPNRHIPRELSAIAMKCLSRDPSRRYSSVSALRRDVSLFLEGRSVSAAPDTFTQAVVKLVKRNRAVSGSVAAAAAVILVLTALFVVRLKGERDIAVRERKAAQDARDKQRVTALAASEAQAKQALRAAEGGRLAEAGIRADAALRVMPDGPWGHYALGTVAFEKKDLSKARRHLEEAVRLDPAHQPSKASLSRVLAALGEVERAAKLVAEAGQLSDWRSLVAAGDALMSAGRYRQAAQGYERAMALVGQAMAAQPSLDAKLRARLQAAGVSAEFEGFYSSIRELPGPRQARRLTEKLAQSYGADVRFTVQFEGDGLYVHLLPKGAGQVRCLDALRGMPLIGLWFSRASVRDLSPLRGMPLRELRCANTPVSDLTALRGMPLRYLEIASTGVSDLASLKGMPLARLSIFRTPVRDLAPLQGMRLEWLNCSMSKVTRVSPLKGMPLKHLQMSHTAVKDLSPLKGMPLARLEFGANFASDLTPLKGAPLTWLNCAWNDVKDLSPLVGMPLAHLECQMNPIGEVTPLKAMPLTFLNLHGTEVADLTPLGDMALQEFYPPPREKLTPESLRLIETLKQQGCQIKWKWSAGPKAGTRK